MTDEERKSETALWDQVLAHIPSPFRGRVEPREGSAVIFRECWTGPTHILASINLRRDGTVPGRDGCTICGYRSLGGMEDVDIYVW